MVVETLAIRVLPLLLVVLIFSKRTSGAVMRGWRDSPLILAALLAVANGPAAVAEQGQLDAIREDVRNGPATDPPQPPAPAEPPKQRDDDRHWHHGCDEGEPGHTPEEFFAWAFLGGAALTSPIWAPHAAVGDEFSTPGLFARYPYDQGPGYMILDDSEAARIASPERSGDSDPARMPEYIHEELLPPARPRRCWSGRVRFDYADSFDDLQRIGGHLLLTTTSRWGLDAEVNCFREPVPGNRWDELWMGDCNVVFRFAQSPQWQWRTGLGFNWLDDPRDTDFGFNFTYGVDFFPRRPWVLSATLDWGTLGSAERFHFRTTAGVIVHRFEVYTGYEYYDIGNTQLNALIGGVRVWF